MSRQDERAQPWRSDESSLGNAQRAIEVVPLEPTEIDVWIRLRRALWPEASLESLTEEALEITRDPVRNQVYLAKAAGAAIGFVEVSLRDWAEGCASRPVGYVEGWYVEPAWRGVAVGRRLIDAAEDWARRHGCSEIASDAELGNVASQRAHEALGFEAVIRCVSYRKSLK